MSVVHMLAWLLAAVALLVAVARSRIDGYATKPPVAPFGRNRYGKAFPVAKKRPAKVPGRPAVEGHGRGDNWQCSLDGKTVGDVSIWWGKTYQERVAAAKWACDTWRERCKSTPRGCVPVQRRWSCIDEKGVQFAEVSGPWTAGAAKRACDALMLGKPCPPFARCTGFTGGQR